MVRLLYVLLTLLGVVLPYSQFIPFILEEGLQVSEFFSQLFANRISVFFAWDASITAVVFIVFLLREQSNVHVRRVWIPLVLTFLIGVSCGFPLYLYMREREKMRAVEE